MTPALRDALSAAGAVFTDVAGHETVLHYGDPAQEYSAVRTRAGLVHRADLARIRMWGRDPVKMLHGLITNDLAGAAYGKGVYAAMLTAKGRTVAELRAFRTRKPDAEELLVDLPVEAAPGAREHLKKFVPPLFARWQDVTDETATLGVYGPGADSVVHDALGIPLPAPEEDTYLEAEWQGQPILAIQTRYAGLEPGYDLTAPAAVAAELWNVIRLESDVTPVGFSALETLRIEAGRPRYGHELSEETIPTEAFQESGLLDRAISFSKGCYTGQEVIVRIAHRGHVNRHLRGLLLGDRSVPEARTPLVHPESGKEVGWVTSAARSPLLGQTIALGFVRREAEPGTVLRIGGPEGEPAEVVRVPFSTRRG